MAEAVWNVLEQDHLMLQGYSIYGDIGNNFNSIFSISKPPEYRLFGCLKHIFQLAIF